MKIQREQKKATLHGDSRTPSLEKELLVEVDPSTNKIDITAMLHDAANERVYPGNSGYGMNFVLSREEIIELFKLLEGWVDNNAGRSNKFKVEIATLNNSNGELKRTNAFLEQEKKRLIASNEINVEKLKKLNNEVRDRNTEIIALKLKLGLSLIKEYFPEEVVEGPAKVETPKIAPIKEESVKEEKPKLKPGVPYPFAPTYKPESLGGKLLQDPSGEWGPERYK